MPKTTKRTARKRAFYFIYECIVRDCDIASHLSNRVHLSETEEYTEGELPEYARSLIEGVASQKDDLESKISELSTGWKISRIPKADLALLLVGGYELPDLKKDDREAVTQDYIDLAKEYGAKDDSFAFVHALLDNF